MTSFMLAHICPELVEPREEPADLRKAEEGGLVNPKTELIEIKVEFDADVDSSESSAASTPSSLIGAESPESAKERKSPRKNTDRPPFSYNALIAMAIQSSPVKRMSLAEIYQFIASNFPYYARQTDKQWQNSVRHNLSLHKEFIKVPNPNGRGNCWAMTDAAGTGMYISSECGKFKRRVVKRLTPPPPAPVLPSLPLAHFPFPHFPMAPGATPFVLTQNPHLFQFMINAQNAHGL